jgi:hypothetical protein
MPRWERRRHAEQLQALGEAHDISALFPWVRPRDPIVEAFAERVALELDPADYRVPTAVVEEGLALLDAAERRRIVDEWAERYPDRWASISAAAGDVEMLERAIAASAVRGAISERRPTPRELFIPLEGGALRRSPCAALALVLAPPLVWSRDEALLAAGAVAHVRGFKARFDALEQMAPDWVGDEHVERVRTIAARVRSRLPVGLPRATETVVDGCRQVERDEQLAEGVAAVLLASYALSLG